MRVAIVGNFGLTGKQTMAMRALPLAEALARRGHAVCLMLPVRQQTDVDGPRELHGVRVRRAGRGPRLWGLSHLWQLLLLAIESWRWRPTVLYCFKPIAYSGGVLAIFWLLRRMGIYQGTIALDTDDWEGDGGWNELQPFPGWLKRFLAWQEQWSLRRADLVTVASKALVEMVERAGVTRVVYAPNAVDESSPGMSEPSAPDLRRRLGLSDRPVILLYTRFIEFQLDRVLEVFATVLTRETNAVLLVVGQGLDGEEKAFKRQAEALGIGDRLLFGGWVPKEEVSSYLAAADIALYPMDDTLLNRTKCPVKLLDLLAAGVPVVADSVGQAAEYVVKGRTGMLVSPGDSEAMAEAAVSLLADPARRAMLGEAARLDARSRWSWEVWAPEVERALALRRHRGR